MSPMPNSDVRVDTVLCAGLIGRDLIDWEPLTTQQAQAQLRALLRSHAALEELVEIKRIGQMSSPPYTKAEMLDGLTEYTARNEKAWQAARKCVDGSER